jgi:Glycosyl hydrolases family 32 C terminal
MKKLIALFAVMALVAGIATATPGVLQDKTLVVGASPDNLTEHGGSVLIINDGQSHFDGLVFGEITPRKWMAGSDGFSRTMKDQGDWPEETVEGGTFVQMAIVYRRREVTGLRNGREYAHYVLPGSPRAFVDNNGAAYLSYWMLWGARGIGLARSGDPAFDSWTKLAANPVIRSTEWGVTEITNAPGSSSFIGSADPSNILEKDGRYYLLTGNLLVLNKLGRTANAPLSEKGHRLCLFVSDDLKSWKYLHPFYERKPEWTDRSEDNMCPSFLPLPSKAEAGPPSGKHLLRFISHNRGCQYQKELVFDSTRSGRDGRIVAERAPLALSAGESLRLRVLIDKLVIEVYANDRQAIGRCVFPARNESLGVALFAQDSSAPCKSINAWEMMPANPF